VSFAVLRLLYVNRLAGPAPRPAQRGAELAEKINNG